MAVTRSVQRRQSKWHYPFFPPKVLWGKMWGRPTPTKKALEEEFKRRYRNELAGGGPGLFRTARDATIPQAEEDEAVGTHGVDPQLIVIPVDKENQAPMPDETSEPGSNVKKGFEQLGSAFHSTEARSKNPTTLRIEPSRPN